MVQKRIAVDRNYGIDLLRIVSMIFVPILHTLGNGGVLGASEVFSVNYELAWFLEVVAYCAVNCYALISGYVGYNSKFKYTNIVILYLQVIFYTIIITVIFFIFMPGSVGIKDIVKSMFPVGFNTYWYFTAYFCMFFFIPFLNCLLNSLDERMARKMIITIVIIFSIVPMLFNRDLFYTSSGYSALWLTLLYLIGGYIKKYDIASKISQRTCLVIYCLCIIVSWTEKLGHELLTDKFLGETIFINYTSPTMLLSSIVLILFFSQMTLGNKLCKFVSFFASVSFGVYLIHDAPLIREIFIKDTFAVYSTYNPVFMVVAVIGTAVGIWFVCSIIDKIRFHIFKSLKVNAKCIAVENMIINEVKKISKFDKGRLK